MKSVALWLLLIPFAFAASIPHKNKHKGSKNAVNFSAKRPSQFSGGPSPTWQTLAATGQSNELTLNDARDLIYMADVTIGGNPYLVQLDTGSSDLWVHSPSGIPNSLYSDLSYTIEYGIGHAGGRIATASVDFAGFNVPRQAFIDATDAVNPVLDLGALGVLGLGFTSISNIASAVNSSGETWGNSLLWNIFSEDPTVPNFIGFLLGREDDPAAPVEGSFAISEFDDDYPAIANAPHISTFPVSDPSRWTVLLDSFASNGKPYTVKSAVAGTPAGKVIILLDSGTTFSYAPESVVRAMYANVTGAKWNPNTMKFTIPCDQEVDISVFIGGQQLDLHPLDAVVPQDGNPGTCVSSWIAQSFSDEFDWLVGANFLRSFYSVYDFSAVTTPGAAVEPFVQLLPLKSAQQASVEFHNVRGGQPTGAVAINPSDVGVTDSGSNSTAIADNSSIGQAVTKILNYLPIILGVLGLNALVLVLVVVFGIVFLCRRSKSSAPKSRRRSSPTGTGAFTLGAVPQSQGYRPVSTVVDRESRHERESNRDSQSLHKSIGPSSPITPLSPHPHSHPPEPAFEPALLAPPAPRYDSSTLPNRHAAAGPAPDMGAPNYNSMTF